MCDLKVAEFFDKDKKTMDETLDKRIRTVIDFDTQLKLHYKNCETFILNAECKEYDNKCRDNSAK